MLAEFGNSAFAHTILRPMQFAVYSQDKMEFEDFIVNLGLRFDYFDPKEPGTPTILKVLEAPMGSEVVASLTEWDLGFLRGLYSAPRNLRAGSQRSAISRQMVKDADKRP